MRELWQTGWMQQNVRMACACLLTEYMSLPWVEGARWFHDTLVDADLAINSMMWQNAGKSGLDQWNFTVSPISKAQDPSGEPRGGRGGGGGSWRWQQQQPWVGKRQQLA
jgi:deoxyribodipyrimidine photolyase